MSAGSELANYHPDTGLMAFLLIAAKEPEGWGNVLLSLPGSFIHLLHVILNKCSQESTPPTPALV